MLRAAKCLLLVAVLFVSADVFAANTAPTFTAAFKIKSGATTGGTLTVKGKNFDLYTLLNLSATATVKGTPATVTDHIAVFTSNANNTKAIIFFNNAFAKLTSNGNFAPAYNVKVSKQGVATATSDKSSAVKGVFPSIKFKAVQGAPTKSNFTFVFSGATVDAATALMPLTTKGKPTPTLAGTGATGTAGGVNTQFTLEFGSSQFFATTDSKGKVKL